MSTVFYAIQAGLKAGMTADQVVAEIVSQGMDNPERMIKILSFDLINLLTHETTQDQSQQY